MNKKKIAILALLMIAVIMLTSCLMVACNPNDGSDKDDEVKIEATEGLLINNGDFKVIDTSLTTYPRAATSWTGAKMYTSSTFREDVTAGVVSLEKDLYYANKSKWNDDSDELYNKLNADGRYNGDSDKIKNALMVYMPEEGKDADGNKIYGPTAYGYTSASFSLDKSAYYKLSVDVLTYKIGGDNEEDRGARIYVSSNTYAEFAAIDTNGEWKTYELFIETSPASSTSLTLLLGLGKYNSYYTKGLTSGYAFFDNVSLEKIDLDEKITVADSEVDGDKAFDAAKDKELQNNAQVATATLKVPNGRFDFGSTTLSSSTAPSSWSLVTGNSGKDDPAPTSLGKNAIVDISQLDARLDEWSEKNSSLSYTLRDSSASTDTRTYYPATDLKNSGIVQSLKDLPAGTVGKNVYMLSQQLMTAQGIRSSRVITIEKNKTYAISINLFTYNVHGAGVSLILTGSDGKDIKIKGISSQPDENYYIGQYPLTNLGEDKGSSLSGEANGGNGTGAWTTYTFYIKGNQYKDYSYNMAIWLGTEGTSDNTSSPYYSYNANAKNTIYNANGTFSNGWVFVDNLILKETDLPDADANADTIKDARGADKYELDCSANDSLVGLIVDLSSDNLLVNPDNDKYILSGENATGEAVPSLKDVVSIGQTFGAPQDWDSHYEMDETSPSIADAITEGIVDLTKDGYNGVEGTYPDMPYDIVNKTAYMMHSSKQSYYEVETATFKIKANQFYRISLWIKTVDVSSTSGAYVYLLDKSEKDDATLTSFTKINTKDYDEQYNDWCELTIVVRGSNDKDTDVAFKFTLGTGDRWAASTLTSGALFVTNMNMSTITYANFKDTTTGTYVKSVDMSTSYTYTFKNGNFDNYDLDDDKLEAGTALANQTVAGTPDDWTINDKTVAINGDKINSEGKKDENGTPTPLFAGVIALNKVEDNKLEFTSSDQAHEVTGIDNTVFNNFYNQPDGTELPAYLDTIAGPNMLAIGSKDSSKKYAIGFASASVTLSANNYYQLSVYAKTVGDTTASIYLSGESSASTDQNYFLIKENSNNGDWTKYTFFIEVGNTSVSIKLNLWLGQNVDNMADEDGVSAEDKAENAKSSGAVFFDKVVYKTIDNDAYSNGTGENNKQISFITDSFDSLSDSADSRTSVSTPNGWTGSVESGLTSSDTKGGIVYADKQYYEVANVEGTEYSRLLGLEYKEDDIEVTTAEITAAQGSGEYENMSEDEIVEALKAQKLVDMKQNNWIPVSELQSFSGHRMLVINNTAASAYTYTSSSNTLKAKSYYEISVYVKTYGLADSDKYDGDDTTIGAYIELYLGSANETGKPLIFKAIQTQKKDEQGNVISNEYVKYTFYVRTLDDDVTSVTLKLSLGASNTEDIDGKSVTKGLTSGYAMFDDVCIQKRTDLNDESFEQLEENDTTRVRTVANDTEGKTDEGNTGNNETPKSSFNLDYLWWMIPTIVIGLVIIAVVIALIIKKLRKNGIKKAVKVESAPANTEMIDKKHNRYDDNKE